MRYYTNGCGGHFNHHVLLDDSTIADIIRGSNSPDIYCSVQSYNKLGTETSSQLVFDIDMESFDEAYHLAREISFEVTDRYGAETSVWFSGSKGFHVVTGLAVYGDMANVGMKDIANTFSDKIDNSMYKIRSMFRLPNSINGKSGLRKIQVVDNEALASILKRAETPQIHYTIPLDFDNDEFNEDHERSVNILRERIKNRAETVVDSDRDWVKELSPCMRTLLTNGVPDGQRWHFCFYLVRFWRECGIELDEAIELSHTISVFDQAGYTVGMIIHYYSNQMLSIGCKGGQLSELMQANCSNLCKYSEGYGDELTRNFIQALRSES